MFRTPISPEFERFGKWYDKIISTLVELDEYLNKIKKKS